MGDNPRVHSWRHGPDGKLRCEHCGEPHRNTNERPFGDQAELVAYLECAGEFTLEPEVGKDAKRRQKEAQAAEAG